MRAIVCESASALFSEGPEGHLSILESLGLHAQGRPAYFFHIYIYMYIYIYVYIYVHIHICVYLYTVGCNKVDASLTLAECNSVRQSTPRNFCADGPVMGYQRDDALSPVNTFPVYRFTACVGRALTCCADHAVMHDQLSPTLKNNNMYIHIYIYVTYIVFLKAA